MKKEMNYKIAKKLLESFYPNPEQLLSWLDGTHLSQTLSDETIILEWQGEDGALAERGDKPSFMKMGINSELLELRWYQPSMIEADDDYYVERAISHRERGPALIIFDEKGVQKIEFYSLGSLHNLRGGASIERLRDDSIHIIYAEFDEEILSVVLNPGAQ